MSDLVRTVHSGSVGLDLARIATERGFVPKVVVVDSLSDGYALGNSAPRAVVDGVCKLAIEQGWGLILIEEVADGSVSPWAFSVDTVLSLQVAPPTGGAQARRELLVTKHRFGSCEPGPHRLQIEPQRVRVIPPFSAYRNAVRDLELPPASKNRSLRIPVVGIPPDWEAFRVPDGEGRCITVEGEANEDELYQITGRMGSVAVDDVWATGQRACLALVERSFKPLDANDPGFVVGTLHQFIDGEDWLEDALNHLEALRGEIARVRIGPTDRLAPYENIDDLRRAISLLAGILSQRGLMAVVFGEEQSTDYVIRAGIVTDTWRITRVKKDEQLTISATNEGKTVTFSPALSTTPA